MSEQINEQISALLDGELPEAELSLLLRQIEKQPDVLQKAQAVQQARLCVQGDRPNLSTSQSLRFTARVQSAIRDEQEFPAYDLTNSHILAGQLEAQGESQRTGQASSAAIMSASRSASAVTNSASASSITKSNTASNDSGYWKPLFGTGIAAAVALVAVSAWQTQTSPATDSLQSPLVVETSVQDISGNQGFDTTNIPVSQASNFSAVLPTSKPTSASDSSTSYTVPNLSNLDVNEPFSPTSDVKQVKYSDYLLQNQVAPKSTSSQLSRLAQQMRATHTQQFYIDPKTGLVVMTIKPIDKP